VSPTEEITQALRRLLQLKEITPGRAEQALSDFGGFVLQRYSHRALLARIWQLRESVTAYDGAYIALADSERALPNGAPLRAKMRTDFLRGDWISNFNRARGNLVRLAPRERRARGGAHGRRRAPDRHYVMRSICSRRARSPSMKSAPRQATRMPRSFGACSDARRASRPDGTAACSSV